MSDDEDDYLSDKFLLASAAPAVTKTYSDLRKDAQKKSFLRNEQNRQRSNRELEQESREEGLSKSLFERAKEEEAAGIQNKGMSMLLKMGFKPGQSLGNLDEPAQVQDTSDEATPAAPSSSKPHITVPIAVNEWDGRKGIGTKKRALSPSAAERIAKMAKMAQTTTDSDFRDRARKEYEERRAEGRLVSAQSTCTKLDEEAGKQFNVLSLNLESMPSGLMEALDTRTSVDLLLPTNAHTSIETRVRRQMQSDALQAQDSIDGEDLVTEHDEALEVAAVQYEPELLEEVAQFLRLQARDRLELVVGYLRDRYRYCYWCGCQFKSDDEMASECPGPSEDEH
ncbi:hypothetical protein CYLTODRAFT_343206 [Cylindrobasidium torrendii FP15055 ss-10]|uniref:G-patch domain-containing protein n=1 Tax=Cylindrobasidium torrendii FP15055 ss-10 TaxID=1314674 RepID=A0A0D7BTH8_9AGAR|nr:hypothetical protein CYLTODRAFT_343206 [Cylindrobasidium torrendii FP15055 ss-10]